MGATQSQPEVEHLQAIHSLLGDEDRFNEFCQRHLECADADVDGTIDSEEAKAATASIIGELLNCSGTWQPSAARLDAVFARCDANEDGSLQGEEFKAFVEKLARFMATFLEGRIQNTQEGVAPPPPARKRVVAPDGQSIANRGLRPCEVQPTKASAWAPSREGELPAKARGRTPLRPLVFALTNSLPLLLPSSRRWICGHSAPRSKIRSSPTPAAQTRWPARMNTSTCGTPSRRATSLATYLVCSSTTSAAR